MPGPDVAIHSDSTPRRVSVSGLAVREDTAYTDYKGREKRRLGTRTETTLAKLRDPIGNTLEPEEVVLFLAPAVAPAGPFEQWSFGWYIYKVKKTVLVFTNRRILAFLVDWRDNWREAVRSVYWGDLEQARIKGSIFSRSLELKGRAGNKEVYWNLKGGDARKMMVLAETLLPQSSSEMTAAQQMVSLCPDCRATLAAETTRCAHCNLRFKDKATMIRYSLLLPGGGYFYCGQAALGVFDFLIETALLFLLLLWVLVALGAPEPFLEPLEPAATRAAAWAIAGFFGVLLGFEKLMTIHHGQVLIRLMIPERKPDRATAWTVAGGVTAVAMALLLWWAIPSAQPPLATVSEDLVVTEAHFGLFHTGAGGDVTFEASDTVPRIKGLHYGWVLRLRSDRSDASWSEEIVLPTLPGDSGEEPLVATNEGNDSLDDGILGSAWSVGPEDPSGEYTLRVFVEGVLVKTFTFRIP